MSGVRLRKGMLIRLRGREYTIEQRIANGDLQIRDVVLNTLTIVKETALIQSIFTGDLELYHWDGDFKAKRFIYEAADFTQIPEIFRNEAKRKHTYISRYYEALGQNRTREQAIEAIHQTAKEIGDIKPPSVSTFYRWLREYESSGRDIRALIPAHKAKGNRNNRLSKEVGMIIKNVVEEKYLSFQRLTGKDVYDMVVARIAGDNHFRESGDKLVMPSRSAIYRTIAKLDGYDKIAARYGKKAADMAYHAYQKGPRPSRPLERVETDHTKFRFLVVDTVNRMPIGRPWLTSQVDVFTKSIAGVYLGFEPPSYLSVMQCLRNAIAPKTYVQSQYPSVNNTWDVYGIPETIVVDNGREFHSTHMEDACLQLGIAIQYAPPRMPWYKATVERHFGTLKRQLIQQQPGASFSKLMEGCDYDPREDAVISLDTFLEILHIWIVDIYQQTYHRGINVVPAKIWKESIAVYPPALPPSKQDWDVLIGRVMYRSISRSGIEFLGLLYNSPDLVNLRMKTKRGEKTLVKYDPTDLSCVYAFDSEYGNSICVPAIDQNYTKDLTLWQHNVVRRLARREAKEVDIVALARAKEKIQQIVENEWNSTRKSRCRHTMARWLNYGGKIFPRGGSSNSGPQEQQVSLNVCQSVKDPEATAQETLVIQEAKAPSEMMNSPKDKKECAQGAVPYTAQELDLTGFEATYDLPK